MQIKLKFAHKTIEIKHYIMHNHNFVNRLNIFLFDVVTLVYSQYFIILFHNFFQDERSTTNEFMYPELMFNFFTISLLPLYQFFITFFQLSNNVYV